MRALTIGVCLLLFLLPMPLREADLDYVLAAAFVGAAIAGSIIKWRLPLSLFDAGWLTALAVAVPHAALAYSTGAPLNFISTQAMIFVVPAVAIAARLSMIDVTDRALGRIALLLCAVKVIAYAPYAADFLSALTTVGERTRFHDFSGVVVCMFLVGCLLAGAIKGWVPRATVGLTAVLLLAAAAHRSLYIAVLVQLAFGLLLSSSSRGRQTAIVTATAIAVALLATPFGGVIMELMRGATTGVDGNTQLRVSLSEAVWNAGFEHPYGHGFGGYFMYGVARGEDIVNYALQHNSYLTYLYYIGWVPFAAIVVSTLATILMVPAHTKAQVAMKSAFIGMSVFACFNMFLENPIYALLYWSAFGVLTAKFRVRPRGQSAIPEATLTPVVGNAVA